MCFHYPAQLKIRVCRSCRKPNINSRRLSEVTQISQRCHRLRMQCLHLLYRRPREYRGNRCRDLSTRVHCMEKEAWSHNNRVHLRSCLGNVLRSCKAQAVVETFVYINDQRTSFRTMDPRLGRYFCIARYARGSDLRLRVISTQS